MNLIYNQKSPTRIEGVLHQGDELAVSPELGARLLAANPGLRQAKGKPAGKPAAGKGKK